MIDLNDIKETTIGPEIIITEISKKEDTHQVSISHLIDLTDAFRERLNKKGYNKKIKIDISNNAINHMLSVHFDNFELISNRIIIVKKMLIDYEIKDYDVLKEIIEYLASNNI